MADDLQLFTSLRYDPALVASAPHAGWNSVNSSALYMLDFHRDRLLRAASYWNWTAVIQLLQGGSGLRALSESILASLEPSSLDAPLRVRVAISKDGTQSITHSPVPPTTLANLFPKCLPPLASASSSAGTENDHGDAYAPAKTPVYEVVVDSVASARSEYTHFKTTRRIVYDGARQRAGIALPDLKEVLVVNEVDGSVMEGSVTTPYFWRHGRWVTPAVSKGFSKEAGCGGQDGTSRRWALETGLAVEGKVLAESLVDGEECWLSNGVRGFVFGKVAVQ